MTRRATWARVRKGRARRAMRDKGRIVGLKAKRKTGAKKGGRGEAAMVAGNGNSAVTSVKLR